MEKRVLDHMQKQYFQMHSLGKCFFQHLFVGFMIKIGDEHNVPSPCACSNSKLVGVTELGFPHPGPPDSELRHDRSDRKKGPDVEPPAPEFDPKHTTGGVPSHASHHYLFRSAEALQHIQRLFQSHLLVSASSLN